MFRRKQEPPVVEFASKLHGVGDLYGIEPTRKFMPQWWRDMKRIGHDDPFEAGTIKSCPAIIDALKGGWIMPTPVDVAFDSPDYDHVEWKLPDGAPQLLTHQERQTPGMPRPPGWSSFALKWDNLWVAKTPPGYSLRVTNVPLEFDPPFDVFPAIVDTDYHHHLIPVFRYRWMGQGLKVIEAGTPLCHLTLVRREDEATFRSTTKADPDRYWELARHAMGGVNFGRRLMRGGYKGYGRRWKRENGVRY